MKYITIYLYISGIILYIDFTNAAELSGKVPKTRYLSKIIISCFWPLFPIVLTIVTIYRLNKKGE